MAPLRGSQPRVHSSRICGSIFRQVTQSWVHSGPHESTLLGTPFLPRALAIHHDSQIASALPSPEENWMNRVRSTSRWRPERVGTKCSGEDTQKSSENSWLSKNR